MIFTYTPVHCLEPLASLVSQFNDEANKDSDVPPVTCIIADGLLSSALKVAQQFNVARVLFCTISASALLAYTQFGQLVERGYTPLKDESYVTNGYLDTIVNGGTAICYFRATLLPDLLVANLSLTGKLKHPSHMGISATFPFLASPLSCYRS
ncbi:hypothetical protein POM88_043706 [Heracleum sosnowskyi]|uniref:Uncharacterized protein n=1 Tax=Heracleum sosnowskyi TaxID=360622 RepID=A0AAD8H419_9APIA|nr:hypothetical protein POM88_043706 [Heracleum sosnowskyi]